MSLNRREFIKRTVVAAGLLVTGAISALELLKGTSEGGATNTIAGPTLEPPAGTTSGTAETLRTVTVTEYVSAGSGQSVAGSQSSQQTSQTASSSAAGTPSGYVLVTALSGLAGKTSAYFDHPSRGLSLLLNLSGQWKAFSATCTHAPCTVQFTGSTIYCSCHGGTYDPSNGSVLSGPPPAGLPEISVLVQNNNLYVAA